MKDDNFDETMNRNEEEAWTGFKNVVNRFLGNKKESNYKFIVDNMLQKYMILGCNMSLKVHFLHLLGCPKSNPLFHSTKFTDNL